MTLIRISLARPCRFHHCRFPQPAVIGGTVGCTQPYRPPSEAADRFEPDAGRVSLFHGPLPIPTPGLALRRRAIRDGLHRVLQLSDPALWPLARHERRP